MLLKKIPTASLRRLSSQANPASIKPSQTKLVKFKTYKIYILYRKRLNRLNIQVIGGKLVNALSGKQFDTINPSTEQKICSIAGKYDDY